MTDNLDDQTIFMVPAENLPKFEAQCAKLSKKAVKIGCSPIVPFVFGHHTETLSDGQQHRVYEVLFTVDVPKIDGWQFVARLDHSNETGNIVRTVPNIKCEIPETYRTCKPHCDHCNLTRIRRDTFLLRSEDGAFKQVGSNCLVDFFGHDPIKIAKMAELLGFAREAAEGASGFGFSMADLRYISVEDFAATAAWAVRTFGWTSGKAAYENESLTSTKSRVFSKMWPERKHMSQAEWDSHLSNPVTDADRALATEALAWAESLTEKANKSDYEHNICVLAGSEMMEVRSAGLCASIVGVYVRKLAKDAETAAKNAANVGSTFLGAEGVRLRDISAILIGHRAWEGDFGMTHLYTFRTETGNVIKWFGTVNVGAQEGAKVCVTGTVKKHEEYNGVKQTVMSRCKVKICAEAAA